MAALFRDAATRTRRGIAGLGHRALDMVLQNRVAGHTDMGTRDQDAEEESAPIPEVIAEVPFLLLRQNGEAGQGTAVAAADLGREPPHAAASGAKLGQFFLRELQNPVRRVGAYGLHGMGGAIPQPVEAIDMFGPIHVPFFNYRRKTSK